MAASLGILFARRLVTGAFFLFGFMMAVAALFALGNAHYSVVVQVVLYVGGVMVLVIFALFLYTDPMVAPSWRIFRENTAKALMFIGFATLAIVLLPWSSLSNWAEGQSKLDKAPAQSLAVAGKSFIVDYPFEFELLGILLLASILVAGWFVKQNAEAGKS